MFHVKQYGPHLGLFRAFLFDRAGHLRRVSRP